MSFWGSIIVLFLIATSSYARATEWGLNDVTVLLPLPKNTDLSPMIRFDSATRSGDPLVPHSVFDHLPPTEDPNFKYSDFRLVGIRVDPCFTEGSSRLCRKQVRLIWQPLKNEQGLIVAKDSAMHAFYTFSDRDWESFMKSWRILSKTNPNLSLQVHPTLAKEGYNGALWPEMKELILKVCDSSRLTRVTAMRTSNENSWEFLGFDLDGNTKTPIQIPGLGSTKQTYSLVNRIESCPNIPENRVGSSPASTNVVGGTMPVMRNRGQRAPSFYQVFPQLTSSPQKNTNLASTSSILEFSGQTSPPPNTETTLSSLIADSVKFAKTPSSNANQLMREVASIENPRMHNPGTIDCLRCHLAQAAESWGIRDGAMKNFQFSSQKPLQNNSPKIQLSNQVRAFGYFDRDPVFSQRVINESAAVAEYLEGMRASESRVPASEATPTQNPLTKAASPPTETKVKVDYLDVGELVFPGN